METTTVKRVGTEEPPIYGPLEQEVSAQVVGLGYVGSGIGEQKREAEGYLQHNSQNCKCETLCVKVYTRSRSTVSQLETDQ